LSHTPGWGRGPARSGHACRRGRRCLTRISPTLLGGVHAAPSKVCRPLFHLTDRGLEHATSIQWNDHVRHPCHSDRDDDRPVPGPEQRYSRL